jgi:23S rRNA G2069 N7-methylase RlmK/C1962 C5-methylase RlmI
MEDKTALQSQMLANRLVKRFRHLKKWARRTGAGAFRLYDRDIPEIPLVLDYYGNCDNPREAAISGALYKRPYEKDPLEEEQWLSAMKESAASALGVESGCIFIKQRERQRGASQYTKINAEGVSKIISEGGLLFKVNLSDYLDTGLFLDRRFLRALIRSEANGKNVLNLFSYTGAFSVYAASGGAASTCSVDLSNTYLNWAKENFKLNGISDSAHKLIRADALDFISKAASEKKRWDMIIVDPPAFSNSKKMKETFDLKRDITDLLGKCLPLLAPGGKIYCSLNVRHCAPKQEELEATLQSSHSKAAGTVSVTALDNKNTDEDFKGRKMPASYVVEEIHNDPT